MLIYGHSIHIMQFVFIDLLVKIYIYIMQQKKHKTQPFRGNVCSSYMNSITFFAFVSERLEVKCQYMTMCIHTVPCESIRPP